MSFAVAVTLMVANIFPLPNVWHDHVLSLNARDLDSERAAIMLSSRASKPHSRLFEEPRLAAWDSPSDDLAVLVGDRRSGQLEMGALGGGRSDAPGLAHIGIGWDF